MLEIFRKWYDRYFFEEESILLLVLLAVGLAVLITIGDIITPVIAAIVLAYLMQGLSAWCVSHGAPQWLGVSVSFLVFVGLFFGFLFLVLPLVWQQTVSLFTELPRMIDQIREWLIILPQQYPDLVTERQVAEAIRHAQDAGDAWDKGALRN